MPARRRGQEARRAQRRASRASAAPRREWDEVEQGWIEHQEWERVRRQPLTPEDIAREVQREVQREQRREQMWAEILRARDAVLADFARWEAERR